MQHKRFARAGVTDACVRAVSLERRAMSEEAVPQGLLTSAEIAAIEQPIERARSLPRRAFFDPAFYEFEVRHWLTRTWIAVAFGDRIPNSGDARPLTVLGQPLILVRGSDRRVRAFHNVVPYDGCEALRGAAGGLSEIVTPYHGICYDLDGRFIRAPYWNGTPDGGQVVAAGDLLPVRCAEWLGTIFLNLDGAAEPFESYLEPVTTFYADHQLERLRVGCDEQGKPVIHELECRANWKTMYENYSPNVYHESFVHDIYRKSPDSPRVDRDGRKTYREILDRRGFLGLAYDNRNADSFYGTARALPPLLLRDGGPSHVNSIVNMYPNWVITVLADQARVTFMLPEGPELCQQTIATLFDESIAATPADTAARRRAWSAGIKARAEDNAICESVQRARCSPACDSQFFNPFWDTPHYVLTQMFLRLYRTGRH
jgi:phenylpropionate dioxygenase-like ring-hydroxylating dioxygenase large terminal subunit